MDLSSDIEWQISPNPVPYAEALAFMEARAAATPITGRASASAT